MKTVNQMDEWKQRNKWPNKNSEPVERENNKPNSQNKKRNQMTKSKLWVKGPKQKQRTKLQDNYSKPCGWKKYSKTSRQKHAVEKVAEWRV